MPSWSAYGMTETGLALSNPLHGERRPNSVGFVLVRKAEQALSVMALRSPGQSANKTWTLIGIPTLQPGYEARIVDEASPAAITRPGEPGQLLLRGTPIFKVSEPTRLCGLCVDRRFGVLRSSAAVFHMQGYWNRPDATAESFTPDGWYKTGDLGTLNVGQ